MCASRTTPPRAAPPRCWSVKAIPAPAAPAAYHLQRTAQGIRRFDETNQGGVLPALSESYLEIPFPLNFGCTLRQIDKTNVDSGSDVDGDGMNDSADIVADLTVLGKGSASAPADEFAECIVIQQRITYTMHATKTGTAIVTLVRRTQWLVKDIGAIRRETIVDGSTVVEELITTNRTLATGSGDAGLANPAVGAPLARFTLRGPAAMKRPGIDSSEAAAHRRFFGSHSIARCPSARMAIFHWPPVHAR